MAFGPRLGRRLFGLIPAHLRCKFCNAPFRGPYARAFRRIGYTPSRKNPNICARCIERAPQGGALVQLSVFFADVRGYTSLASLADSALRWNFDMTEQDASEAARRVVSVEVV